MAKIDVSFGVTLQIGGLDSRNFVRMDVAIRDVDSEVALDAAELQKLQLMDAAEALFRIVADKIDEKVTEYQT